MYSTLARSGVPSPIVHHAPWGTSLQLNTSAHLYEHVMADFECLSTDFGSSNCVGGRALKKMV